MPQLGLGRQKPPSTVRIKLHSVHLFHFVTYGEEGKSCGGKKKKLWVLFYHLILITRWGVNAAADLLVDRGLTCLIDLLIPLNCWPTPPTLTEGTDLPQVNTLPKVDSNCTLLHASSTKTKRQPGCGWRHCWLQCQTKTSFCHCACHPVTDMGGCWQEKRKKKRKKKDCQGSL